MGLLEEISRRAQILPPALPFPDMPPSQDEAAMAEAARVAAGQKLAMANRRRPANAIGSVPDEQSAGVQFAMGNAPEGTGVPFSTDAGMLAPPVNIPSEPSAPVPLPMARPPEADQPSATDVSSRAKAPSAPLQIAPQMPPSPAVAQQAGMMGEGPSILDRIRTGLSDNSNTLLALGAGFAGAPNIGQGISRAAAAAIPAAQADIRNKLTRQTQTVGMQALIEAGVPHSLAVAALGNPAIMKSVTENYLGDRKGQIIDIGFDRYGQPIKGIFDPFSKKITPVASALPTEKTAAAESGGTEVAGTSTATDISAAKAGAPNPGVGSGVAVTAENDITGPDYLQRIKETDPAYARQVEQVLNGDAAMPTGRQAQTPQGRKLRQDVLTVEPGASDSDFTTRQKTRQSYASGNDAKVTKSINTTLHHAGTLEKAINDLDNFSTLPSVMNPVRGAIKGEYDTKYQKARAAYDTAVANFAKELDFAVSGGRPTVSGTKHQMEGFDPTASKVAQMEKLRTGVDLLNGRLESHARQYNEGLKKSVDPQVFLEPSNRAIYQRMLGLEAPPEGKASAAPAVAAPAPGRYEWRDGQLVPMR